MKNLNRVHSALEKLYHQYADLDFIADDPIQIPYLFDTKADREISGLFAAIFAWGQRKVIIKKTQELMDRMDMMPHQFILNASTREVKKNLSGFVHRTFQYADLEFFVYALRQHYQTHESLEQAFLPNGGDRAPNIEGHLNYFYLYMKSLWEMQPRTRKHLAVPLRGSAAKKLCMYLRWMVRKDHVDLGLWRSISPRQLIVPLDVHVIRTAEAFGMIDTSARPNWATAVTLTQVLASFDSNDPVKYDLALFSAGVNRQYLVR